MSSERVWLNARLVDVPALYEIPRIFRSPALFVLGLLARRFVAQNFDEAHRLSTSGTNRVCDPTGVEPGSILTSQPRFAFASAALQREFQFVTERFRRIARGVEEIGTINP